MIDYKMLLFCKMNIENYEKDDVSVKMGLVASLYIVWFFSPNPPLSMRAMRGSSILSRLS